MTHEGLFPKAWKFSFEFKEQAWSSFVVHTNMILNYKETKTDSTGKHFLSMHGCNEYTDEHSKNTLAATLGIFVADVR